MKNKTMFKRIVTLLLVGVIILTGISAFLWFKPHRDVAKTSAFETLSAKQLTTLFDKDAAAANAKYLADDGNSKVLIVEGTVKQISFTQAGELLLLLQDPDMKVGVQAKFTAGSDQLAEGIQVGQQVRVKGSIAAGNRYDPDLELYEHALLVDSSFEPEDASPTGN